MKTHIKCALALISTGFLAVSSLFPSMTVSAEPAASSDASITQFMDCFEPMPIVEKLSSDCWGVDRVGNRDQGNGLEDRDLSNYCYWDGGIIKAEGKYYMFASRWDQKNGHEGWMDSQAIYATSNNFYGPYEDQGPLWPDWCDGAGHNVFPFTISTSDPLYAEGYRYAISISDTGRHGGTANGTIHIAKDIDGPWNLVQNGNNGKLKPVNGNFGLSNISIAVRHDGKYEATNRNGDLAIADSLAGGWDVKSNGLWWNVDGMPTTHVEDPVIWYSDGLYHIVANKWDAKQAYYLTSEDGITNWVRHSGTAYTPKQTFMEYEDGTVNNWTKLERPNVYIEDGKLKAMTFAVIDVEKDDDDGYDQHGSKIVIVPFDGHAMAEFAKTDVYISPGVNRPGLIPAGDTTTQSWKSEANNNYGGETTLSLQYNNSQGLFGEGTKAADNYDCKIAYIKYDISNYLNNDIEKAVLSLIYDGQVSGSNETIQIRTALSDSNWNEGTGKDTPASTGELTWGTQPPTIYYDKNSLETTTAVSEEFDYAEVLPEIKIDVTHLVKKFIKEHPEETVISFALSNNEHSGRIRIGSKEGGDSKTPKLQITTSGNTVNKSDLEELVTECSSFYEENYTSDSWKKFKEALDTAKNVLSMDVDQTAIDNAKLALESAKNALVEKRAGIEPIADTTAQSWGNESTKNYGGEPYLQMQYNDSQGVFGEGEKPTDNYDCKLSFIKYDISEYKNGEIDSAFLSLIYDGEQTSSNTNIKIQAALSENDWQEGNGKEYDPGANGNKAEEGDLIWSNQPALLSTKEDIVTSNEFSSGTAKGTEIKLDVTNLLKKYIAANPDETVVSFALSNNVKNVRIHIASKEAGETMSPKLHVRMAAPALDTSKLESLYNEYITLPNNNYTSDSWTKFQSALAKAKAVLDTPTDQNAIDQAIIDLEAAKNALVLNDDSSKPGKNPEDGNQSSNNNGNNAGNNNGNNTLTHAPKTGDSTPFTVYTAIFILISYIFIVFTKKLAK